MSSSAGFTTKALSLSALPTSTGALAGTLSVCGKLSCALCAAFAFSCVNENCALASVSMSTVCVCDAWAVPLASSTTAVIGSGVVSAGAPTRQSVSVALEQFRTRLPTQAIAGVPVQFAGAVLVTFRVASIATGSPYVVVTIGATSIWVGIYGSTTTTGEKNS